VGVGGSGIFGGVMDCGGIGGGAGAIPFPGFMAGFGVGFVCDSS